MKRVIAVRHCKASGQERNAVLTKEGIAQSQNKTLFNDETH